MQSSALRNANRHIHGKATLAGLLVAVRHVFRCFSQSANDVRERHASVIRVTRNGQLSGVDRLDGAHRVALDAWHLHEPANRVTGHAEVVFHRDLCGHQRLGDSPTERLGQRRGRHRARHADLGLAATQVIADLSSCFALAALLASTIEESADATTAGPLKVGYSITAFGFLLFFGPLSVATNLEAATERHQHRAVRSVRGMVGMGLLLAWAYLMLIIVLLMFEEDVFCPGPKWFNGLANLQGSEDPCHGHG